MLPNPLLRSLLAFGGEKPEHLSDNLAIIRQEVEPQGVDREIVRFLGEIFDRSREYPTMDLVRVYLDDLERKGDPLGPAGRTRLELLEAELPDFLHGAPFRYALDQHRDTLLRDVLGRVVVEASSILTTGLKIPKRVNGRYEDVLVRGSEAALTHLTAALQDLSQRVKVAVVEGSLRRDGSAVLAEYLKRKAEPEARIGVLSGLPEIDGVHRGLKRGELCLLMGFVSHMKSTLALNWAYHAAVHQRLNVALVSLEMTIPTIRTLLYVMHSTHPKFATSLTGISYDRVMTGTLTDHEEALWEAIITDLGTGPYGQIYYKEPQESVTVPDIQRWAEAKHRATPLDLLVIDYLGLVDPEKAVSGMERGANLNRVVRQAKMLATTFAGVGIPVISPFQANRQGLKDAEKMQGSYTLLALADAHEAERSSDVIYYTYLNDQLRAARELVIGNLKHRNGPVIFPHFRVFADPATRRIEALNPLTERQRTVDFSRQV